HNLLNTARRPEHNLMTISYTGQNSARFLAGKSYLSIQGKFSCEPSQISFFRSAANDREIRRYAIVLQKFHRLQKQVDALVGNEPPNENELLVAGDVRDQPKGGVI